MVKMVCDESVSLDATPDETVKLPTGSIAGSQRDSARKAYTSTETVKP